MKPLDEEEVEKVNNLDFNVKICDMGNACYTYKHYSDIIQTREYRGPEVILEGTYDETADLWSLACMVFELVTGDYLFRPRKGKTYKKADDHLALITELIGDPTDIYFLKSHRGFKDFYNEKTNKLKRISKLKYWNLYDILTQKYYLKPSEALFLTNFLLKMLTWNPKDRASARELLEDPWLKMP